MLAWLGGRPVDERAAACGRYPDLVRRTCTSPGTRTHRPTLTVLSFTSTSLPQCTARWRPHPRRQVQPRSRTVSLVRDGFASERIHFQLVLTRRTRRPLQRCRCETRPLGERPQSACQVCPHALLDVVVVAGCNANNVRGHVKRWVVGAEDTPIGRLKLVAQRALEVPRGRLRLIYQPAEVRGTAGPPWDTRTEPALTSLDRTTRRARRWRSTTAATLPTTT